MVYGFEQEGSVLDGALGGRVEGWSDQAVPNLILQQSNTLYLRKVATYSTYSTKKEASLALAINMKGRSG